MALHDLILVFFIVSAFLLRSKGHWKRTGMYVMAGVFAGDVIGAILIGIFYHWHPGILLWARYLMPLGAVIGGLCDWLKPVPTKAPF